MKQAQLEKNQTGLIAMQLVIPPSQEMGRQVANHQFCLIFTIFVWYSGRIWVDWAQNQKTPTQFHVLYVKNYQNGLTFLFLFSRDIHPV